MKSRYYFIDIVRAISILGVIAIHTYSYHLTSSTNYFIWNSLQFIVISFVFCSGYVTKPFKTFAFIEVLQWLRKRFARLYIPFFMYFIVHYSLFLMFPNIFHNVGMQKSVTYVVSSILLIGGLNTNWLPLLFMEIALLTPLLLLLGRKRLLYLYIFLGISFTFWITFIFHFPYAYYRLVMWLPWSLVFVLGWYMSRQYSNRMYVLGIISMLGIFGICYYILSFRHQLVFYDNKYPPNLYYLSYGVLGTLLLVQIAKVLEKVVFARQFWVFLSSISYSLFFIHFIVLDMLELLRLNHTWLESLLAMGISITLLGMFQWMQKRSKYFSTYLSAYTTVRSE